MASTSLDTSLGALLVGVMTFCTLFGICIAQSHTYFRTYENDPMWLKSMVGVVLALELGQTICVCHTLYIFAVADYGNPTSMLHAPKSLGANVIIAIGLKLIFNAYYIYRIFKLTSNKLVIGTAILLDIASMSICMVVAVYLLVLDSLRDFNTKMSSMIIAAFTLALVVDGYISVVIISWFAGRRHRISQKYIAMVIDRIMLWAVQTGLISSLNFLVCLITYSLMSTNFIYLAFYINQPKLYSICLLASLNARSINTESSTTVYVGPGEESPDLIVGRRYSTSTTGGPVIMTKGLREDSGTPTSFKPIERGLYRQANDTQRFVHPVPSILSTIRP